MGDFIRSTFVYGGDFWEFYYAQTKPAQKKIDWVIGVIRAVRMIPDKFFKHLEGTEGLYEIRVQLGSDIFRVFCFFDKGALVI